jgi:mono/diheme cytochrome c family protein
MSKSVRPFPMHTPPHSRKSGRSFALPLAALASLMGCTQPPSPSADPAQPGTFASVQPVLERNCVHCHGSNRLGHMPAFDSTHSLAKLTGAANWIVPGKPDMSRFFQVVTFADEVPMAMPPSGHAISRPEIELLRAWIRAGAPVPEGRSLQLKPQGPLPRSI